MVPVAGKPALEHTIEWLKRFGIRELVINLHYLPEVVQGYFEDGSRWNVHITYSFEPQIMGTAGALRLAHSRTASHFEEPFILWYGDNLSTCNIDQLIALHQAKSALATIALFHRQDVTHSGIVGLDMSNRITRFLEKPRVEQVFSHWVNAGIYVLDPAILSAIPPDCPSDFGRDVFPALLASHRPLCGYCMGKDESLWWIDTPQDLQRVQQEISPQVA
jgi:NDP-sugar pyrophosphorylase family protein